jgi:hypothetical protein
MGWCPKAATIFDHSVQRMGRIHNGVTFMRSSLLAACAVALLASAAAAQDHQGGGRGFLSPEQRAMYMQSQPHQDWQSMTQQQREAARDQMRGQWQAMSDADKQALKAKLQAQFDALPADRKQQIEQRIAEHRSQRQQGQQNQGQ